MVIDNHLRREMEENDKQGIKGKAKWLVYLNHFIVGWDDNIWGFALGLFLAEITPQNLQFIASYGLIAGIAVLLFGTVVGDWVDRTSRLTVARTTVLVQNSALILCCLLVYVVIEFKHDIAEILPNEGLLRMCYALIIIIAILSNLTNMARTTAIERDWIIEICGRDRDMLASLSATMRRISLLTMVIAPIVTGQILSRTSHSTGALVVAGWNFMTIFVEYGLLWKIYQEVPQLKNEKQREERHQPTLEFMHGVDEVMEFKDFEKNGVETTDEPVRNEKADKKFREQMAAAAQRPKYTFWTAVCASFITLKRGWNIYRSYSVIFAGLSLASLYVTVLSFHSITVGYAYSQGLGEDLIGGLVAASACSGIVGTFIYPIARKHVGLERTGLYALAAELSSLTLCVISIFCPGSPFELVNFSRNVIKTNLTETVTASYMSIFNSTSGLVNTTTSGLVVEVEDVTSYFSISLMLTGIIASRLGLWMADLTVAQLFMESVDVTERGIVAGVQNAINQLMDMVKFAFVILLPVPEQFGYLVIISYCFICLGWILFAIYVKKTRGFLIPCC